MGCDIHIFLEYQVRGERGWRAAHAKTFVDKRPDEMIYMNKLSGERNYDFFALLNQVRGEFPESFEHTYFLPVDISNEISQIYEAWGDDAHSAGSRTLGELKEKAAQLLIAPIATTREKDRLMQRLPFWDHGTGALNDLIAEIQAERDRLLAEGDLVLSNLVPEGEPPFTDDQLRVVFWFDN